LDQEWLRFRRTGLRADSWILHELPERLVADWYNLQIFTEYDLQVATYYWLRHEFE
jgi:hypothetical protein